MRNEGWIAKIKDRDINQLKVDINQQVTSSLGTAADISVEEGMERLLTLGGFPEPFLSGDKRRAHVLKI